jgi:hypothetical protein
MSSFLTPLKFTIIIPIIVVVWTIIIGGPVEDLNLSLPFTDQTLNLQEPLEYFSNVIATVVDVMPWMEIIFNIIVYGIIIKFILVIVDLFWRLIGFFFSQ